MEGKNQGTFLDTVQCLACGNVVAIIAHRHDSDGKDHVKVIMDKRENHCNECPENCTEANGANTKHGH